MRERIKKIFENLEEGVDVILISTGMSGDKTFFYITGVTEGLFENSIAIAYPSGDYEIICPKLEEGIANASVFQDVNERNRLIKEKVSGEKIGVNGDKLTYKEYRNLKKLFPKAKFFDVWEAIAKARLIKDKEEIKNIKKACNISASIAERLYSLFDSNIRECDVKAEINYMMEKENASPAFDSIVAFGKNSARPHHKSVKKKFVMPVLCDFGAAYKNYCSDVTRTFVSKKQREVYDVVKEGKFIALDMMGEGVKAGDVAKSVNEFFIKKGFKKMIHSLGHSLGLSPHDGFSINEKNDEIMKENMILAVEPAIYLKNFGIRIEDDVLVKKNGVEVLTK